MVAAYVPERISPSQYATGRHKSFNWHTKEKAHFHKLCGTAKFDNSYADAQIYAADKWVLKEVGKFDGSTCASLLPVQFHADLSNAESHSSNGSGTYETYLDMVRSAQVARGQESSLTDSVVGHR